MIKRFIDEEGVQVIVRNKKALHEYFIKQVYEAGIVLQGTEVKSLRQGKSSMADAYATIRNNEAWLIGLNISEFKEANINNHDPVRDRKLLLNKNEIQKLTKTTNEKGFTIVPLALYFRKGKVKVELGLAQGKKMYDKRESIAKKDFEREQQRKMKF